MSSPDSTVSPTEGLMPKLVVEAIGTFFLLLTIAMLVLGAADAGEHAGLVIPVGIGLVLTALVFAFGPISGAHFNPAVTIGLYLAGRCPKAHVAPYLVAECIGATAAAFVALQLRTVPDAALEPAHAAGFAAEAIWTFLLVCVILQITSKRNAGNQWFGIVVGTTVAAGAYVMGPDSGAAFNPAVYLGLALDGVLAWSDWWLYIGAPILGGCLAAAVQQIIEPSEVGPE